MKCGDFMENNNENDIYYEDNSFNNQGMDMPDEETVNFNQSSGAMTNFAKGFSQGFTGNSKNNPALGQRKMNDKNLNNENNKNKDNSNAGKNKNNDNGNSNSNGMPGAVKKPDSSKDNSYKKDGFNDKNRKQGDNNSKKGNAPGTSKIPGKNNPLNRVRNKGINKESSSSLGGALSDVLKTGVTSSAMRVLLVKGAVVVLPAVIIIIAFCAIIMGLIGTAAYASMCGMSQYSVNGADATSFMCSMQSPFGEADYVVTSTSGWRIHPISGGSLFHYGTDVVGMGADKAIYAVADGVVEEAGNCGGYGNCVLINHGDKFYTRYGHLDSIVSSIKAGDDVKGGQKIGTEGNTGNSAGVHLHFEILDKNKDYISANPFFGYSDQGYEECVNDKKNLSASRAEQCMYENSGKARYIGEEGFKQICGKGSNYVNGGNNNGCCNNGESSGGEILDFINTFEGSGPYCGLNKQFYRVYQVSGDRPTVGHGVTSDYIDNLVVGQCLPVKDVDAAQMKAIDVKRNNVRDMLGEVNITSYQEDALTSMAYNGCATFFGDIGDAIREGGYEDVWLAMKDCTNGLLGLQRRRKAEFALYVTGDYTIAKKYKTMWWDASEYNDYDSDNIIAKKASGSSSSCKVNNANKTKVVELVLKEMDFWNSSPDKCGEIKKYISACGGSGIADYCAGFVSYILGKADIYDSLGVNGCLADAFRTGDNVNFHKRGSGYMPEAGDIILFDFDKNGVANHVAFVEYVEGETVHTIGGNQYPENACGSYGNVTRQDFHVDLETIMGFVSY